MAEPGRLRAAARPDFVRARGIAELARGGDLGELGIPRQNGRVGRVHLFVDRPAFDGSRPEDDGIGREPGQEGFANAFLPGRPGEGSLRLDERRERLAAFVLPASRAEPCHDQQRDRRQFETNF